MLLGLSRLQRVGARRYMRSRTVSLSSHKTSLATIIKQHAALSSSFLHTIYTPLTMPSSNNETPSGPRRNPPSRPRSSSIAHIVEQILSAMATSNENVGDNAHHGQSRSSNLQMTRCDLRSLLIIEALLLTEQDRSEVNVDNDEPRCE
jgi:hypothetical protein